MKKLICALAAISLVLVGCGKDGASKTAIVDDGGGYADAVQTEPATTLPKVKQTESGVSENSDTTEITTSAEGEVSSSENEESPDNDSANSESEDPEESSDSPKTTIKANGKNTTPTEAKTEAEVYYLEGIVCEVKDKEVMINEKDLSLVNVSFAEKNSLKNIRPGDSVLIKYDGILAESYPAQAKNAYSAEVTKKAEKTYEYKHFKCGNLEYDLEFSILVPSDWESREIEYPKEGDFTDWGIRFTAPGQSGGLDISWFSAFAIRDPYDITPITVNKNSVDRYSRDGNWRFYVYDNSFVASNTFYGKAEYGDYTEEIEFMLSTLEFAV